VHQTGCPTHLHANFAHLLCNTMRQSSAPPLPVKLSPPAMCCMLTHLGRLLPYCGRFTVLLRLGACRVAATSLAALQCVLHCIIWVAVRVSWANWWVSWVPPTNGDKNVGFHPLMGINPC